MSFPILTLDQLIEAAVNHANNVLVGKSDAQLAPLFHIQFKNRPPALMSTPWNGEDEKVMVIRVLKGAMATFRQDIVSYSFMSEAWLAVEHANHPTGLMPSEREDKREVVLINACSGADSRLKILAISRDDKGRVNALTADPDHQLNHIEGRLFNLLDDEP